jgi:putative membrane protein
MRIALTGLLAVVPAAVTAHQGADTHAPFAPSSPSPWDLIAIGLLIVSGSLYAIGRWRLRQHGGHARRREAVAFFAGWSVMLIAVLPPIDGLAAFLFSAHMLQHELLMLVGAPLMIAGRPLSTCLWGMPALVRPRAAGILQHGAVGSSWRWLTTPAIAWALHGVILWVWHVPALYEWAIRNEGIHAVQHAMFVGTSLAFWWGLIHGRYGRAGYGASVFYVFTTVVHTGLLGAVFALTPTVLYPVYAHRSLDPVADQQLAGLVMWVPAGLVLTVTGIALFAAWLGEAERRGRAASLQLARVARNGGRGSTDR